MELCLECELVFRMWNCVQNVELCSECGIMFRMSNDVQYMKLCSEWIIVFRMWNCVQNVELCSEYGIVFRIWNCIQNVKLCSVNFKLCSLAVETQYRFQHECDVIGSDAPSQDVGHWSRIILHTAHVFLGIPQGVFYLKFLRLGWPKWSGPS